MGGVLVDVRHAANRADKPVTPLFSVVIPVFNRAAPLTNALESVLAQSCQDFEIIVVDDGSTDNPKAAVDAVADPRIRFAHQENRGAGAARNAGIDMANGTFIAFLDSDDRFLPHHLQTTRTLLENRTDTAAFSPVIMDRGHGRRLIKPPRGLRAGENMADYLLRDRGFIPTDTLVLPREMAARVRYDESVGLGDDKDFAIRLALAGCEFLFVEAPGALYDDRYDPNRLSSGRKGAALVVWLERMRPRIPARAYRGCRGWIVAKGIVTTNVFAALWLYLNALLRGCYRPRLAAVIFLQIFLPDRLYRALADTMIARQ
jgi:glycosyltransferase involved in cell wall biosynthesis